VASVSKVERAIAEIAAAALKKHLAQLRVAGIAVLSIGIVATQERDPAATASPNIRAHAAEGVLFRRRLETGAVANGLRPTRLPDRDLETIAMGRLKTSTDTIDDILARFGAQLGRLSRADEKTAIVAASLAFGGPP
jgi:hypothetical protein